MSEWKAPKFGSPVWMGIPATDVARATKFYATVFNFSFRGESADHTESKLVHFDFNPDVNLGGGIQQMPDSTGIQKAGPGGVCVFWMVEDADKIGDIIEKAGGKVLSGVVKQGENGLYRYFEDTEGNVGGAYQHVPTS